MFIKRLTRWAKPFKTARLFTTSLTTSKKLSNLESYHVENIYYLKNKFVPIALRKLAHAIF